MVRGLSLLRTSVAFFLRIACTCTAPEPALGPPTTRFSAPHFAHLLSIRVLPRLIAMALCSIASFTKRSVSSRIACFDISGSLAFCKIGHRAGRGPRQRRCCYRATPSRKVAYLSLMVNASRPIKKPGRVVRRTAFTDSSRGSPLASPSAGGPDRHASGKNRSGAAGPRRPRC
jgi:hypothetical protein